MYNVLNCLTLLFAIKNVFVFVSKCPYLSQCDTMQCNVSRGHNQILNNEKGLDVHEEIKTEMEMKMTRSGNMKIID